MSDDAAGDGDAPRLVFEDEIDAPPATVWRAILIPEFREQWLPDAALGDPVSASDGAVREVRFTLRDGDARLPNSAVTFRLAPNGAGGTRLVIVHEMAVARPARRPGANDNAGPLMLLAA